MTKNILAVVGGLALVALLGANAVATFGAGEQSPSGTGGGLRVADLPISRIFQQRVSPGTPPFTFPSNAGILIESVHAASGYTGWAWFTINGIRVADAKDYSSAGGTMTFSPPILVPPGSTLEIVNVSQADLNLSGYQIFDTDL